MQTDLFAAKEARDRGLDKVTWNSGGFVDAAKREVSQWTKWEGTGEDLRHRLQDEFGFANPHHPNAWGALTRSLATAGLIFRTGEWRTPRDVKSHARPISVWRTTKW